MAAWFFARFGMDAIRAFLNPLVAAVIVGGFILGSGIGWYRAKTYFAADLRVAQAEADLKKRTLEYNTLVRANATMSAQLAKRTEEKAASDARVAAYDRMLSEARASGKCVDQVTPELLGQMSDK